MSSEYLSIFNYNMLIRFRDVGLLSTRCYHRTSTSKLYLDRSVTDHSVNESSNVRLQGLGSTYVAGATGVGGAADTQK